MAHNHCINNVGEYYSTHYLETTFEKDIKELGDKWKSAGSQSPANKLKALSAEYFRMKANAIDQKQINKRVGSDWQAWHYQILNALGFHDLEQQDRMVDGDQLAIPVLASYVRNGEGWLCICEAPFCLPTAALQDGDVEEEPLISSPQEVQFSAETDEKKRCLDDWQKAIKRLFNDEDGPRWVMLLAGSYILLLDSHVFAYGRYIQIDLDEAFARTGTGKDATNFNAVAALIARETLAPGSDNASVLHESLQEGSHKFAHAVSEQLQNAVRQSIELIANEWVKSRRNQSISYTKLRENELLPDGSNEVTGNILMHESLVYVYRIIFCLFAEARGGELGILPINDNAYRLGYSLESLRDLELVNLTDATKSGTYMQQHLAKLFEIIHDGFNPEPVKTEREETDEDIGTQTILFDDLTDDKKQISAKHTKKSFHVQKLTATLFTPDSTPLLSRAKLSNECLQQVIKLLSLGKDTKSKSVGRINYGELGINQLGAVYEGLLSWSGKLFTEDQQYLRVHKKGEDPKSTKTQTWFVRIEREEEFDTKEIEKISNESSGNRIYKQGDFTLHLTGLERESSASYYTPEVLTKCLVEQTINERLKEFKPEDADKILSFAICEPAMGSGAFLIEAIGQLAERYLDLKQQQIGESIDPSLFHDEKLRVMHYLATRCVYGVDLNPTAVELGEISLWLATIHQLKNIDDDGNTIRCVPGATPWFGLRLRSGNSLIGARRAVWTRDQLQKKKHFGKNSIAPRLLKPGEKRKKNEIYHFIVFDEDMVPTYREKIAKEHDKESCDKVKHWIKTQVNIIWEDEVFEEARIICDLIDSRSYDYTDERKRALKKTACTASVWPCPMMSTTAVRASPDLKEQEQVKATLESSSGHYQRIKLVMDTWCSLFYWDVNDASNLPTRDSFLACAKLILTQEISNIHLIDVESERIGVDIRKLLKANENRIPDAKLMSRAVPWIGNCQIITNSHTYMHWELSFPEVLGEHCDIHGFDLMFGNPPWIKASWSDDTILSEYEPILGVRSSKSATFTKSRNILLAVDNLRNDYLQTMTMSEGSNAFLRNNRNYNQLRGIQTNLYKNFIARTWGLLGKEAVVGMLHPEGIYDDPKGGRLRADYYKRLYAHYQFKNEMILFPEVDHHLAFSINIYGNDNGVIKFDNCCNLFDPATVNKSINHINKSEPVPGIKTEDNKWECRAHTNRIVAISDLELGVFGKLFEKEGMQSNESRLPQVHSLEIMNVLQRFSKASTRLVDIKESYYATEMFHESNSQSNGIITREDNPCYQPIEMKDWVVSGPHFYVGCAFNKTARKVCTANGHYDEVDLTNIPDDYLPLAVYRTGNTKGSIEKYNDAIPVWPEGEGKPITKYYRYINRKRAQPTNERTLIPAVIPPGPSHIHAAAYSLTFDSIVNLIDFSSCALSICYDFLVRSTGKTDIIGPTVSCLPLLNTHKEIKNRFGRLVCLTKDYESLWAEAVDKDISSDAWSTDDQRLLNEYDELWDKLEKTKWKREYALRTDFSRRQALLEIDVLVAMKLGLQLQDLLTIYRVQFSVMRTYEKQDLYDSKGLRIPGTHRKAQGGKEFRDALEKHDGVSPLVVSWKIDDGNEAITKTFHPPFIPVDREADYEQAWKVFEERFAKEGKA